MPSFKSTVVCRDNQNAYDHIYNLYLRSEEQKKEKFSFALKRALYGIRMHPTPILTINDAMKISGVGEKIAAEIFRGIDKASKIDANPALNNHLSQDSNGKQQTRKITEERNDATAFSDQISVKKQKSYIPEVGKTPWKIMICLVLLGGRSSKPDVVLKGIDLGFRDDIRDNWFNAISTLRSKGLIETNDNIVSFTDEGGKVGETIFASYNVQSEEGTNIRSIVEATHEDSTCSLVASQSSEVSIKLTAPISTGNKHIISHIKSIDHNQTYKENECTSTASQCSIVNTEISSLRERLLKKSYDFTCISSSRDVHTTHISYSQSDLNCHSQGINMHSSTISGSSRNQEIVCILDDSSDDNQSVHHNSSPQGSSSYADNLLKRFSSFTSTSHDTLRTHANNVHLGNSKLAVQPNESTVQSGCMHSGTLPESTSTIMKDMHVKRGTDKVSSSKTDPIANPSSQKSISDHPSSCPMLGQSCDSRLLTQAAKELLNRIRRIREPASSNDQISIAASEGIDERIISNPSEWEVTLLVDMREKDKHLIQNSFLSDSLPCEISTLSVGDFLFVARPKSTRFLSLAIVLDAIIERKTFNDLGFSIIDGRYEEQKVRMADSGVRCKIYLIEGVSNVSGAISSKSTALRTAMLSVPIETEITVTRSRSIDHSICILKALYKQVHRQFMASRNKAWQTYDFFQKQYGKKQIVTVGQVYGYQLRQVPGCSAGVVETLMGKYDTFASLQRGLLSKGAHRAQLELSEMRKAGGMNQKFGPKVAEILWKVFCDQY